MTTSSNYAKFGPANPLTPEDIDPVPGQCVGNIMFTKSGVPGYQMQKDFCPRLMSQRCSVNWDNFCEAYLTDSNAVWYCATVAVPLNVMVPVAESQDPVILPIVVKLKTSWPFA